jgi:hypothetical protein
MVVIAGAVVYVGAPIIVVTVGAVIAGVDMIVVP